MGSFIRVADFDCRRAFVLIGVVVASGLAAGRTIHVPADYPTVQGAIDATQPGDTVIVAPGRYFGGIRFPGYDITLRSEDPTSPSVVMSTILDGRTREGGYSTGPVVTLTGKETAACRLAGFTITNGYGRATYSGVAHGGGIDGNGTPALIDHNRIVRNVASGYTDPLEPIIIYSYGFGGGVLAASNLRFNLIAFNMTGAGYGGGVSDCSGVGNIIVYNSAWYGGGVAYSSFVDSVIAYNGGDPAVFASSGTNNIIWGNEWKQIDNDPGEYNCIQGIPTTAGVGLINADPRFVNPSKDVLDFHLRADSPCIDAGTSAIGSWAGAPDIDGDPRPFRAYRPFIRRGDGTGYDIGADEFVGHPTPAARADVIKALILGWPLDSTPSGLDLNQDGAVDAADFILARPQSVPPSSPTPRVFHVPAEYLTVQGAIDSAQPGDTIIVAPGRYFENIEFPGYDIVLRSEDPTSPSVVMSTILDGRTGEGGYSVYPVVTFTGKETAACRLAGFTITNGYGEKYTYDGGVKGGGIDGHDTSALIDHNRIVGNTARGYIDSLVPSVFSNASGGGVHEASNLRFNLIAFNQTSIGFGGGVSFCNGVANVVVYNTAGEGGGAFYSVLVDSVIAYNDGDPTEANGVENKGYYPIGLNNIIWGNTGKQIDDYDAPGEYNCIQDYPTTAGVGLINADPRFVDPSQDVLDFHLRADSPCIDAGTSSIGSWAGAPDIDGDLRPFRAYPPFVHRGDGTGYDIGADEYIGHPAPSLLSDAIKEWIIAWPMDPVPSGLDVNQDGVVDAADLILALIPTP